MFINNICILASDSLAYLYRGDMSNLGIVMTRTSNFVNYAAQYVFDATNHYGEICCGTLSWACCTCNCSTGICLRIFLDKFRSNTDSFSDISTNNSSKINNLLEITEESVNILSVYTESKISSIDDIRDDTKRKEITNDIKNFTYNLAENTRGFVAAYVRFSKDLTGPQEGFFISKTIRSRLFNDEKPTDLSKYDTKDTEHVGWYYNTIDRGTAGWLKPYNNENRLIILQNMVTKFRII